MAIKRNVFQQARILARSVRPWDEEQFCKLLEECNIFYFPLTAGVAILYGQRSNRHLFVKRKTGVVFRRPSERMIGASQRNQDAFSN